MIPNRGGKDAYLRENGGTNRTPRCSTRLAFQPAGDGQPVDDAMAVGTQSPQIRLGVQSALPAWNHVMNRQRAREIESARHTAVAVAFHHARKNG
jgi:hypothetical protein